MEPQAITLIVQHELQELLQDLDDTDGEVQSRKKTSVYGRRDQGSTRAFLQKGSNM